MKPLSAIVLACLLTLTPARAQPPAPGDVGELLAAIEHADEGVESIQASVQYDRRLELQDDRILRRGTLYFITEGDARKFAVRFDKRYVDGVERAEDEMLIFDGRWMVEKREEAKQFIRREIAREGADFDPLRLGEGPFPIPIGQRAQDIRARYDATMPGRADGLDRDIERTHLVDHVRDAFQLKLVPHDLENADLVEIRLWYRFQDDRLVPRLARTVDPRGDVTYVQLINIRVNEPVPSDALSVDPPSEDKGWSIQETRLPSADEE